MLRLEQQAAIRQMWGDKVSISAIARELVLDRKTVRTFLLIGPPGERHPRAMTPSVLDPFESYLQERIVQYPLSSIRLYEEIQRQGYTGGYGLVKEFV